MQEAKVEDPEADLIVPVEKTYEILLSSTTKQKFTAALVRKITDWWILELGALVLSAGAIVGMSIFLLKTNRKPAPAWSYDYSGRQADKIPDAVKARTVTFNSVLSLFSIATRFLLAYPLMRALGLLTWVWYLGKTERKLADVTVFDKAARNDPIGALKLLWLLKGIHFAAVGALIVLVLEILGFFVQQLVHMPVESWPDIPHQILPNSQDVKNFNTLIQAINNGGNQTFDGVPTTLQVARISNATSYAGRDIGEGPYYSVDLDMKANIWAGLFATDNLGGWFTPTYFCSSGNCEWDNYNTLGVCSRCADLTSKLNKNCSAHTADLHNTTGCDVTLPNGFALGGPEGRRNHLMATSTDYDPIVYSNYTNPLAMIQTITTNDSTLFVNQSTLVLAFECVLIPCVINYDYSLAQNPENLKKFGINNALYNEVATKIYDDYRFNTSVGEGPAINITYNLTQNNPTTYYFHSQAYTGLKYYLRSVFNGYVTTDGNARAYSGDNKTRPVSANAEDAMQSLVTPPSYGCTDIYGNAMYDTAPCTIQFSAVAMTNIIRDFDFDQFNFSTYAAIGTTWKLKPTIDVIWLWIIPIASLWTLCAILAMGTIWKARRARVGGMDLNPLTYIFLDLESKENAAGWWHGNDEAKKMVEEMQVKLDVGERKVSLHVPQVKRAAR